ncbi:MAG: hypothetical protein ACR2P4_09285 [Gammaproteobacteria bacterium]
MIIAQAIIRRIVAKQQCRARQSGRTLSFPHKRESIGRSEKAQAAKTMALKRRQL